MQKRIIFISTLFLILLSGSCGKGKGPKGLDLEIKLKPQTITDFLFVEMEYEYRLDPGFQKLAKDYKMFTHLWRPAIKEMLLVDDHMPELPTSRWQPGQTIKYSRTFFIPQFLNEYDIDFEGYEEIRLSVGFYLPQAPAGEKPIILFEQKLNVQPASINMPEIVYSEGWEEEESDLKSNDPFYKKWRWTNKSGVCIVDNPKKDSVLIIKAGVNKEYLPDQRITLKINDQLLDEFIPDANMFSKEYPIPATLLGAGDEFTLKVESDKTFVPAKLNPDNRDTRELGVQVFFLYFREKAV